MRVSHAECVRVGSSVFVREEKEGEGMRKKEVECNEVRREQERGD